MENQRQCLDEAFHTFLRGDSPEGRSLWISVKCNLLQFHLLGLYSESCVLNEVYYRAIKAIEQGRAIDNLLAWSRATAYNYTRELSRTHLKSQPLDELHLENLEALVPDTTIDDSILAIRTAFEQLSPADRRLLSLSIVEERQWKEIRRQLMQEGEKDRNESALRKAKERALKRLRDNYHALRPSEAPV